MTWGRLAAAALLAVAACAGDTGIIVEVRWDPATIPPDADALRIYVGTRAGDAPYAVVSDGGAVVPYGEATAPYRYLLRPGGTADAIGDLQLAAAITRGAAPATIEPLAAAVYDHTVRFVDGQLGRVTLTLGATPFAPTGPAGECAMAPPGDPAGVIIGHVDDADCDGTPDAVDCEPHDYGDPSRADDADGDGVACGDCLPGPDHQLIHGWDIDPATVFPGQNEAGFRGGNHLPPTVECLHIDFDCSGRCDDEPVSDGGPMQEPDVDGSGADACGKVEVASRLVCPPHPSDCADADPMIDQTEGEPEACDGRDSNCDGRPAPPVPCAIPDGALRCRVGTRTCDDDAGRIPMGPAGCIDTGFPEAVAAECPTLEAVDACLFDVDPLACANANRHACDVGTTETGACASPEKLVLPGAAAGTGCDWRIVGGVQQADWDVGFVELPGGPLRPSTQQCAPTLVARPANGDPRPRTIMILGLTRVLATPILSTFVMLRPDNTCDGAIACEPLTFP